MHQFGLEMCPGWRRRQTWTQAFCAKGHAKQPGMLLFPVVVVWSQCQHLRLLKPVVVRVLLDDKISILGHFESNETTVRGRSFPYMDKMEEPAKH